MKKEYKWGIVATIIIGGIIVATKKKKKPAIKSKYKSDDLNLLLPSFREKVKTLLANMIKKGYDPIPFDTGRTLAEQQKYYEKGTGAKPRPHGEHIVGAAVDIISGSSGWGDRKFFLALGKEAKTLGLTWGGNVKYGGDFKTKNDMPHIQAIPIKYQHEFEALDTAKERDKYISDYFDSIEVTKKIPIV